MPSFWRYGATTGFVTGHSYADPGGFSTYTTMIANGRIVRPGSCLATERREAGIERHQSQATPLCLWSIGHSTHAPEAFVALLAGNEIELVADIRAFPASRRHPHFCGAQLARTVSEHGIGYRHLAALGGRRVPREDSPNDAWRNRSFRGYADYALTHEFAGGLVVLRGIARSARTAMMCSEALWWRCHRRLVADRLVAGGDVVLHIASDGRTAVHEVAGFAIVGADRGLRYPRGG